MIKFHLARTALIALAAIWCVEAKATLIAVLRTPQVTVIAADSRMRAINGQERLNVCKIHLVSGIVYATSGLVRDTQGTFDIWGLAESAIRQGGDFHSVVSSFDSSARVNLTDVLTRARTGDQKLYDAETVSKYVASVVFVKGDLLHRSDFVLENKSDPSSLRLVTHDCPGDACPTGMVSMTMGENTAAEAELDRNPHIWKDRRIVDALGDIFAIQERASPDNVAPPIAILAITSAGGTSWLQNGVCGSTHLPN